MNRSRFSDAQIIRILRLREAGMSTEEICRKHAVSATTLYGWESKYSGLDASEVRPRQLKAEIVRLKRRVADLLLERDTLKGVVRANGWRIPD